jgi:DNA-binding NtrC family response regulator
MFPTRRDCEGEHARLAAVEFGSGFFGQYRVCLFGEKTMVQSMNDNNALSGVRVLVVEDDTLLAMDLKETLVDAGAIVVGVCQTLGEGMARANDDDFAVAVLDFSLGPDTASPLARRLVRRGLPFILYTGKSRLEPSLAEWSDRPIVQKPAPSRVLVSALRDALSR